MDRKWVFAPAGWYDDASLVTTTWREVGSFKRTLHVENFIARDANARAEDVNGP